MIALDSLPYADGDAHPDYEAYALALVEEEVQKTENDTASNNGDGSKDKLHPSIREDVNENNTYLSGACANDYMKIMTELSNDENDGENYNNPDKKDWTYMVEPGKGDDLDSWKTAVERARASYEQTVHRWTHLQMLHHTVPSIQKRWQEEISTQLSINRHLDTVILPLEKQNVQDVNTQRYDAQVVSQDGVQLKRYLYQYQQLVPKCQSLQYATATLQEEILGLECSLEQKPSNQ